MYIYKGKMNTQQLLTKYSDLVKEYMCQAYYDNNDDFINTEKEEEEWETFTEEIFKDAMNRLIEIIKSKATAIEKRIDEHIKLIGEYSLI
jgi:type I site-specific restriction endonuclease